MSTQHSAVSNQEPLTLVRHSDQGDFVIPDWMLAGIRVSLTPKAEELNKLVHQGNVPFDRALEIVDKHFTADGLAVAAKLACLLIVFLAGISRAQMCSPTKEGNLAGGLAYSASVKGTPPAFSAVLQDAPLPKFLDKETKIELAMSAVALSLDGATTIHNVHRGDPPEWELNPIARPFVQSGPGTAAYFGMAYAGEIGTMYLFRRHRWIKRGIALGVTGAETWWGIYNLTAKVQDRRVR